MKVALNYPNLPDGTLVEVLGLGVFPNGEETEVTDEQLDTFVNVFHGFVPEGALTLVLGDEQEYPEASDFPWGVTPTEVDVTAPVEEEPVASVPPAPQVSPPSFDALAAKDASTDGGEE